MSAKRIPWHRGGERCGLAGVLLLAAAWLAGAARAQEAAVPNKLPIAAPAETAPAGVVQAGCSTCGAGALGGLSAPAAPSGGGAGCGSCCGAGCVPGHDSRFCGGWCAETPAGRFLSGFYECLCCPDPCYDPHWLPVADSAFFVDAARPVSQMRLRWDTVWNFRNPDRAEFLWARQNTAPNQVGPPGSKGFGKGPRGIAGRTDYSELSLYSEGAAGKIGVFVETPYRDLDPDTSGVVQKLNPVVPSQHASGFADLTLGTKTLLLDCELLQMAFQFKTFLPVGAFTKGLGTGHVSLEPSLLFALRLTPEAYLQAQLSYWIPIAGDPLYQGDVFHFHMSLNKVLWQPCGGIQVVGTFELNEWTILGGAYTVSSFLVPNPTAGDLNNPLAPVSASASSSFLSLGPGVRLFICDKFDIGVGSAFTVTGTGWADETVRAEFRWRF